ncbi:MAG: hypothetical protein ACLSG8_06450 [Barnesiella sp.]
MKTGKDHRAYDGDYNDVLFRVTQSDYKPMPSFLRLTMIPKTRPAKQEYTEL